LTAPSWVTRQERGNYVFTPQLPDAKTLRTRLGLRETITLLSYGCTKLRLAIFQDAAQQ
jgi:hypothetical protein